SVISWPEPVTRIQEAERSKRLSLDRMMKLLSQVNYAFSGRTSAAHARMLLEGYAVHDWARGNHQQFVGLAISLRDHLFGAQRLTDPVIETLSPFAARVAELGRILNLSTLERDILSFAFLTAVSDELGGVFEQLASDRWSARVLWTVLFDTSIEE